MSLLNPNVTGDSIRFDAEACADVGKQLRQDYERAEPFPSVIIDDFLPLDLLRRVNQEFPAPQPGRFANEQSNLKTGYQLDMIQSPFITNLLAAFNSAQFLRFMEELTGTEGLLSDPYYDGGGLHETRRGGHLSIHSDFNLHNRFQLLRQLNLILFLNEGWQEEYGGHLELWTRDMKRCVHKVAPTMGRAVIFKTDDTSFHGHPEPLNTPDSITRRSIALYYFTVPTNADELRRHTTQFQVRPGSKDHVDRKTRARELVRDLVPPAVARLFGKR